MEYGTGEGLDGEVIGTTLGYIEIIKLGVVND